MLDEAFLPTFIQTYFIALGVLIGGALVGSFGAFLIGNPPLSAMYHFALRLKIWAIVAAIGGTFDTFHTVERGIFQGETRDIIKQILFILSAIGGAQTAFLFIRWFTQEHLI